MRAALAALLICACASERAPAPTARKAEVDDTDAFAVRRAALVEQIRARGVSDDRVLAAMGRVPRHELVPEEMRAHAYEDRALPIGEGQTISQPSLVALMTELAAAAPGARVLEVGTGSGYQAAILAELGARVTTIERHEALAAGARERLARAGYGEVDVVVGDGTEGWPARAPYRSILVTAGGPSVPQPLLEQLDEDDGRLVMPVGSREHQFLTLVERNGDDLRSTELEPVVFVPLIGRYGLGGD
jgi:protein-L-isoaspartate(D-aspartate) O-methyltransferase